MTREAGMADAERRRPAPATAGANLVKKRTKAGLFLNSSQNLSDSSNLQKPLISQTPTSQPFTSACGITEPLKTLQNPNETTQKPTSSILLSDFQIACHLPRQASNASEERPSNEPFPFTTPPRSSPISSSHACEFRENGGAVSGATSRVFLAPPDLCGGLNPAAASVVAPLGADKQPAGGVTADTWRFYRHGVLEAGATAASCGGSGRGGAQRCATKAPPSSGKHLFPPSQAPGGKSATANFTSEKVSLLCDVTCGVWLGRLVLNRIKFGLSKLIHPPFPY